MRVAERYVGNRDGRRFDGLVGLQLMLGDRDGLIGQRRSSDGAEVIELDDQARFYFLEVGDVGERLLFALLGALPISGVKQGDASRAVIMTRDGGAHAGIHAAAEKDDSFAMVGH
jgi:hypothetical protein